MHCTFGGAIVPAPIRLARGLLPLCCTAWLAFTEHEKELREGLIHRLQLEQSSSLLSQRLKLITIFERHRQKRMQETTQLLSSFIGERTVRRRQK